MEGFICSSEIALLIYGYLLECNENLSKTFLQLSPHLLDYRELKEEGHDIPMEYEGLNLKQLLREYATIRCMVSKKVDEFDEAEKAHLCSCSLPLKLSKLLNSNLPKISRMRSFLFNPDSVKNSTKVDTSDNTSQTTETPSIFQCSPVKDHCTNSNAISVSSVDVTEVASVQERNIELESIHNQGTESSSTEINVEVVDNEEKNSFVPENVPPPKTATSNTLKHPQPIENHELNESFDMSTFLKPSNKSKGGKQPIRKSSRRKDKIVDSTNFVATNNSVTAELQPYPEIHYEPVDCNIVTSNINSDSNCVFYANNTQQTIMAPNQGSNRYRNILPKYETINLRDIHPVVVCTPLMPPTNSTYIPPTVIEEPVEKERGTRLATQRGQKSKKEVKKVEEPKAIILPTPTHLSFDDMPNINATPQPPVPPTPQLPNPTPATNCAIINRKQSLSTPRRKSHIRALEFETPQKIAEEQRSATSPKMKPPESAQKILTTAKKNVRRSLNTSKNINNTNSTKKQEKKPNVKKKKPDVVEIIKNNSFDSPPVATLTPVKDKLSSVWDAMTGVSCILGNKYEPVIEDTALLDQSKHSNDISVLTNIESPEKGLPWDLDLRRYISTMQFEHRNETPSTKPPKRVRKVTKKVKKKRITEKKQKTTSPSFRRVTRSKTITISPSKMNVTSKRNTYAISHGSSSEFDDSSSADETLIQVKESLIKNNESVEMTPAKIDDPVLITEETPFTKLLRENVTSVDIDLSMLQTPFFPNTPSLALPQDHITPMHITRATDYSSSSSYYKPELTSPASCLKEIPRETVEELQKSEEFLQDITTLSGRALVLSPPDKNYLNKTDDVNKSSSLLAENVTVIQRVINSNDSEKDISVSVTNEKLESLSISTSQIETEPNIQSSPINLITEPNEDDDLRSIQKELEMSSDTDSIKPLTTKDHKTKVNQILCEGKKIVSKRMVPGKNMSFFKLQMIAQCDTKLSENIPIKANEKLMDVSYSVTEQSQVFNIRNELESKRKHTLEELKKTENKSNIKRKKKCLENSIKKIRSLPRASKDFSKPLICSTPNRINESIDLNNSIENTKGRKKSINGSLDEEMLKEAKKEMPPFEDDGLFPQIKLQTRKKIFMIKNILKREEIINYLDQNSTSSPNQLVLKPWLVKLFNVLFKWLKHPHKQEADVLNVIIVDYLNLFKKINLGLARNKVAPSNPSNLHSLFQEYRTSGNYSSSEGSSIDSSVGVMWKNSIPKVTRKRKKTDDENKFKIADEKKEEVPLPLKKRKNPTDDKREVAETEGEVEVEVSSLAEVNNASHAQIILQDIDVDRFLSRIHGQENG